MSYRRFAIHEWTCDGCGAKIPMIESDPAREHSAPPSDWRTEKVTDKALGLFTTTRHLCPECATRQASEAQART